MAKEATLALKNCRQCLLFEANVQMPKLAPILATKPTDLVHINFVKMEIPGDLRKKTEDEERSRHHQSLHKICTGVRY